MTDRESVLAAYPDARLHKCAKIWQVVSGDPPRELGWGMTEDAAWKSAARRIKRKEQP